MIDIVERLRASADTRDWTGSATAALQREAAEEIERLRAALQRIDGINDNPADFNVGIEAVLRAALGDQ